jgi:FkbM family methyltransferase
VYKPLQKLNFIILSLGWLQASFLMIQKLRCKLSNTTPSYNLMMSENARFPLLCRPNTSDELVFNQIFSDREYSCLDDLSDVGLVIDCGANVGYSAAYFLTRFPNCTVICVEPDPSNFRALEKNLLPYKERVKLIRSGIWSHSTGLKIMEEPYNDGLEWSVQVRESKSDEIPEMQAIDLGTLLRESGNDTISILKMDIEGAEAVVFEKNYESWLSSVENMVIELHDDTFFGKASDIVLNAMSTAREFSVSECGELTVFKSVPNSVPKIAICA